MLTHRSPLFSEWNALKPRGLCLSFARRKAGKTRQGGTLLTGLLLDHPQELERSSNIHDGTKGQRPFGIPFSWRCRQRKRVFPLYRYQHSLTLWAVRGMTHKCEYIAVRGFSPRALARGIHGARTDGSCNHSSRSAEVEKRFSPKIWHTQPPLTPRGPHVQTEKRRKQ